MDEGWVSRDEIDRKRETNRKSINQYYYVHSVTRYIQQFGLLHRTMGDVERRRERGGNWLDY
jgi:hypothetical protein